MALTLPILCRSHSGGDSVTATDRSNHHPHPPSPSLISLVVSVDVKHHVYFIGHNSALCQSLHVMVYVGNAGMPLLLLLLLPPVGRGHRRPPATGLIRPHTALRPLPFLISNDSLDTDYSDTANGIDHAACTHAGTHDARMHKLTHAHTDGTDTHSLHTHDWHTQYHTHTH